jgi:3-hydroxyisobutyrate dehydrogenase-like beta-hydroxyacid dehydrogenase
MRLQTIAILSPGDMGHGVGRVLREHGYEIITYVKDRSIRTRKLANKTGFRNIDSLEILVDQADLILSIIVPSEAITLAYSISQALKRSGKTAHYADCNAISPETSRKVGKIISDVGSNYIDGSIIGGVPKKNSMPRFYVSGPDVGPMEQLDGKGIIVKSLGPEIGKASGIKMCYAGMTKATSALHIAVLAAASKMELTEVFLEELEFSQAAILAQMHSSIPSLPSKTLRWVGEMDEIAATYEKLGLTPCFHQGSSKIYSLLGRTSLADERAETIDKSRTLDKTIETFLAEI